MTDRQSNCRYLDIDRVDIWQVNLTRTTSELSILFSFLSLEERKRAEKFKLDKHKNLFIAARGFLRQILSYYLNIAPEKIEFSYGDRGKPNILNNSIDLQFNLSHAADLALYAIGKSRQIGIDLEYLEVDRDCENIAKRFFSQREFAEIEKIIEPDRSRLFFQLWTAKEAYLKATGEGLVGGLDRVEIKIENDRAIYAIDGIANYNWQLQQFEPMANYLAAIAVEIIEGKQVEIDRLNWLV